MAQSKSKTWSQPISLDVAATARIDALDACLCVRQALCHIYGVNPDEDEGFDFMDFLDDDSTAVPKPGADDIFAWWLLSCDVDQVLLSTKRLDIESVLRIIWPKEMTTAQLNVFSEFLASHTLDDVDTFSLNVTQSDALKRWMNETFLVKVKPQFDAAFAKFQVQEKAQAKFKNQKRSQDAKDALTKLMHLGFEFGTIVWPDGLEDPTPKPLRPAVKKASAQPHKVAAKPPAKKIGLTPRDGGGPNGERMPFPTMRK